MIDPKGYKFADRAVSWILLLSMLTLYWVTTPKSVALWDCPEYVTSAVRLTVGHPPGNPFWMLVEHVLTMFFPPRYAAWIINLSSGLFMALSCMLLGKCMFMAALWVLKGCDGRHARIHIPIAMGAALTAGWCYGFCDSAWYSAVEAEVYAMSVFLTALSVWLMLKWAMSDSVTQAWRYLILLAYIFGLSLGVHQLNLLCIPALAIIWAARREIAPWWKILLIFLLSLIMVGCILTGMMPSSISLAAQFELFAVNTLHLPYLYGVAAYIITLAGSLLLALVVTQRSSNRGVISLAVLPAVFLSGLFIFSQHFLAGLAVSALVSILLARGQYFQPRRLNLAFWMLTMLLTGYSVYAIVPLRGDVASPINCALPGEPFSFAAYQAREQYGGAPLLYGHTPYSKPLLEEDYDSEGNPYYSRYAIRRTNRNMERISPGMRLRNFSNSQKLAEKDSALNASIIARIKEKEEKEINEGNPMTGYVVSGYRTENILTPELDAWLPRITSMDPLDLQFYEDWADMKPETMEKVFISDALDSVGNPVAKMIVPGERSHPTAFKPTPLQHLRYFISYQVYYMYARYLMWNFCGRQNDYHSQGRPDYGNFITGISQIDDAMLGDQNLLAPELSRDNKGRNVYWMLPFLLGIAGIVWLLCCCRRGRIACGMIAILFIMTGVAIVVYLNQNPGEPRERDYSFLGSYMAFTCWIGAGGMWVVTAILGGVRRIYRKCSHGKNLTPRGVLITLCLAFIPVMAVPAIMGVENFDDHDRRGRQEAAAAAQNFLSSLDKDAIIFVDGDNYTFPLWYSQEVEGIRKDVRVINISYLSMPKYAASMLREWDGCKPLDSELKAEDILYNALMYVKLPGADNDSTATASDAFKAMKASGEARFGVGYVTFFADSTDARPLKVSLRNIARTQGSGLSEFRRMMILDIVASNAPKGRPIYWANTIPLNFRLGLDSVITPMTFARRLGKHDSKQEIRKTFEHLKPLYYGKKENLYWDQVSRRFVSRHRADLVDAAIKLQEDSDANWLSKINEICTDLPGTYVSVLVDDTVSHTKEKIKFLERGNP